MLCHLTPTIAVSSLFNPGSRMWGFHEATGYADLRESGCLYLYLDIQKIDCCSKKKLKCSYCFPFVIWTYCLVTHSPAAYFNSIHMLVTWKTYSPNEHS